jgi:hypothetical protein
MSQRMKTLLGAARLTEALLSAAADRPALRPHDSIALDLNVLLLKRNSGVWLRS